MKYQKSVDMQIIGCLRRRLRKKKEVHPLNTGEIFWRKNRRNEIAMDRNVIHKLLVVSRCGLMAAGIIFLIISSLSGTGSKWMIISALGCILISNLFYIVVKGMIFRFSVRSASIPV